MKEHVTSALNIGYKSNKTDINIYLNRKNINICKYLFKSGFINSYFINRKKNKINISFSYFYDKKPILYVKKVSNPGRKVYFSYKQLRKLFFYRSSILILSTNKGILSNKEAILRKVGGELLFIIKC